MLRFNQRTEERARNQLRRTGSLEDMFLGRDQQGRVLRVQFSLTDEHGHGLANQWTFPVGTPVARVRKVRDAIWADVTEGRIRSFQMLDQLRLAVRQMVEELNAEDQKNLHPRA